MVSDIGDNMICFIKEISYLSPLEDVAVNVVT
jgi:hypothetical protein